MYWDEDDDIWVDEAGDKVKEDFILRDNAGDIAEVFLDYGATIIHETLMEVFQEALLRLSPQEIINRLQATK